MKLHVIETGVVLLFLAGYQKEFHEFKGKNYIYFGYAHEEKHENWCVYHQLCHDTILQWYGYF